MKLYDQLVNKFIPAEGEFRDIFQGFSISFVMKIAGLGCAQLFAFVVARYLGADTWGVFSLALSVITIGSILGTLGLDIGLLKLVAGSGDHPETISSLYSKAFLLSCLSSLACTGLVYIAAPWLASTVFSIPSMAPSFKIAAFAIIPFSLINLNAQTLRGLQKVPKFVFLNFVARYLFGLIFLLLLLLIAKIGNITLIAFISGLYVMLILSSVWLYEEDICFLRLRQLLGRSLYRRLLAVSLPLLLASSLTFVKGWIDSIMVGIFLTKADVGIYNIALKLSGLTALILTAVNTVAAPKFAEAYSNENKAKLHQTVQQSTKVIFFGTVPILIVFLLVPTPILRIFGAEFTAGKEALILLSLGNFINALSGSVGYFMQMTDSQVAFQNITLISTALGVLLNYLLIPRLGINGAALSTCVGLIFWNLSCVIYIRYRYGIRTYYNPFSS